MPIGTRIVGFFLLGFSLCGFAKSIPEGRLITDVGVAKDTEPGFVYVQGLEHKIVQVQTERGLFRVLSPSMGVGSVSPGETIFFSGRTQKIAALDIVNTREGYIYRQQAQTMQEQIMGQMARAQEMAVRPPMAMPNTVPITLVETDEQKREGERRESEARAESKVNIWLAALSFIVALLSIERIPKVVHVLLIPFRAALEKIRKRKAENVTPTLPQE